MGGRKSRNKGHGYEREIAATFKVIYPNSKRMLEYQEGTGIDVCAGPWDIQCKRRKTYVSINKLFEVPDKPGRLKALITKADYKPDIIVMPLDQFLSIIKDIGIAYEQKN